MSPQGALLAKPGEELTEKQIRLFKMWGVSEAEVEGDPSDEKMNVSGATSDEDPEARIDALFAEHLDDTVMFQIGTFAKELVRNRR